ncbi:mediator of RNA polymerase II transcription subunit 15-like [Cannabis sativa]|uniref:mediator of RNA polymerase II transcription subunit 15-like n=1 Tax=Cannabis sativa TaxID=3483 RepID=UPI0029CA027E|nr:mediator of RNA polymerase II transcription subunit 15-like [Cannabis sativa]
MFFNNFLPTNACCCYCISNILSGQEKMLEEAASMTDTEDDSSDASASKYKQLKAMNKVLGSRSDYIRGLGYKLKGSSTSSSSTQSQAQSQVPTSSITPEDMGVFAEFMLKMRDKIDQSGTSSDASLHDPRFNNFLQKFLPSQPQGSASSSAPPPTSMPQQQQQQQQQPRSPQQPQFFQQQQQHSPNMSAGSSQSPQLHYMFGLPSQSPPIFFSEAAGGSQTQPMVGNIGGSSQQPYPVYGQFGSLLQQQPVYGQMGGSPQQPMYGGFFSAQSQQQQQQPILVRPHPRPYVEIFPTPQTGQPYYPAPPAQSRENIDGSRLSANADEFLEFTDLNNDS